MAPHADFTDEGTLDGIRLPAPERPPFSESPPRLLIIGAGSRGTAFGKAIQNSSNGICVGVVEPITLKRKQFCRRYVSGWEESGSAGGQEFEDWEEFLVWETGRRSKALRGEDVQEGCDGVFICVQDRLHKAVILGLAPLGIHIMCEKPLATDLDDCVSIYKTLRQTSGSIPTQLFSIGHVLRYSPHNMLLRKLLLEDNIIGDVMSINHTEPVGWWHFAHSFVR
jgi:predicted dehydrogenase